LRQNKYILIPYKIEMKTHTINTYSFNELSEKAQQTAIEKLYDINVDYNWWESMYEDAENIGLKITSFDIERRDIEGEFNISAPEVVTNILKEHDETCETYKTAEQFIKIWQPVFNDYMNEESTNYESQESEGHLQELEEEFLNDLLEDYLILLQHEEEYLTSKEAIIETIEASEYEFTADGEIFNL